MTRGAPGRVPYPCVAYATFRDLVNDVWFGFPAPLRPDPFTYGTAWGLRNRATNVLPTLAEVPLAEAGFVPGAEFELVWLRPPD